MADGFGVDLVVIPEPARNSFSLDSFEAAYDFDSMRLVSLTSYTDKQRFSLSDYTPLLIGRPPEGYPAEAAIVFATATTGFSSPFSSPCDSR